MKCLLFALTLTMSRIKKISIKEYWSTHDVLRTDIFNKNMSRDRYTIFLKMLCFSDKKSERSEDQLAKIRDPFDKLREIFKNSFLNSEIYALTRVNYFLRDDYFSNSIYCRRETGLV
jgi:hypothetical protein